MLASASLAAVVAPELSGPASDSASATSALADIDLVKAIAVSGQSCTVGDRFYTQSEGSTRCLEDEYVMSPGG